MPNRMIKESIWTSPNLNRLSPLAERHFFRLLPLPDDHGCCEITPAVVKGRCYPLQQEEITDGDIDIWQQELENNGIIITWELNGRQFGAFTTFAKHQRIRSLHNRKTPAPPPEIQKRLDELDEDEADEDTCRQLSSKEEIEKEGGQSVERMKRVVEGKEEALPRVIKDYKRKLDQLGIKYKEKVKNETI